ncbi:hypothetical protein O3M35_004775 [Rhynocoris fuscipes]|uniref:Uncharacterized protein n=1 Tax=Rhynocoris fuscipes TaxID=488301 RepID=A0AAW1DI94_9HEMI
MAILWTLADCLEVGIPERFLRPRNFNPHPYLDVRTDEEQAQQLLQDVADLPHPYRLFERPPTRGDVSNNGPIQQTPGTTVTGAGASKSSAGRLKPSSVKHPLNSLVNSVNTIRPLQDFQVLEYISSPADASHLPPLYSSRLVRPSSSKSSIKPKNYAFSYAVKDGHSGDDFSHSQAQAGAKTMGEYRVKLPDGRTQVVSYTADHRGYRADVR